MEYTWVRAGDGGDTTVAPASAGPGGALAPAGAPPSDPRRDQAGALLVQMLTYLETNAERHPALLGVAPVLSSAVAEYRSGQAADPYDGVRRVVQAIQTLRSADPSIPDA